MVPKICSTEDCDKIATRRKMCQFHYRRWMAEAPPELRRPPTAKERFWAKVNKTSTCWLWEAGKSGGRGTFNLNGNATPAHRLAYQWSTGDVPEGDHLERTCDEPSCVNPGHFRPTNTRLKQQERYMHQGREHCSEAGCGLIVKARKLCRGHYEEWREGDRSPSVGRTSAEARFWGYVDKSGDCWAWTSNVGRSGYGYFKLDGRNVLAHRIAYTWSNGPIPEGMQIDHLCFNRACVNAEHLRLATAKQNAESLSVVRAASGVRGVYQIVGTSQWSARLTHHGVQISAGKFSTIAEAEAAVIAKRNELYTHNHLDRINHVSI